MDLFRFIGRGAELAGNPAQHLRAQREAREQQRRRSVISKARDLWRNALTVDETRGWLSLLETNTEVLSGLCMVLSLVAFAKLADAGEDDATVRVIRGALSAIQQAGAAGSVITHDLLVAVASACRLAKEAVDTCSDSAIEQAAHHMHALSRLQGAK